VLAVAAVAATDLRIGFQSPYLGGDCPGCPAAFISAVAWLNADPATTLGDGTLTVVGSINDSSTLVSTIAGAYALFRDQNVMVLVGDLFSSRVRLSALVAEIHEVPIVGYGATSDEFTSKTDYPFFSRVVSPDAYQARALVDLILSFGWERVGVLFSAEAYGTNFNTQFSAAAATTPLIIHTRHSIQPGGSSASMGESIRQIVASGVRVIVFAAVSTDVTNGLRAAGAAGALGPEYTWIGTDGVMTTSSFTGVNADIGASAAGMLGIFPGYENRETSPPGSAVVTAYDAIVISQTWSATAAALNLSIEGAGLAPIDPWAFYVWDATVFTAVACARAVGVCGGNGSCVQEYIRNNTLVGGATGDIVLDAAGDRPGRYSLLNLQPGSPDVFVSVGSVVATGTGTNISVDRTQIVWASGLTGTLDVPDDGDFSVAGSAGTAADVAGIVGGMMAVFAVVSAVWYTWFKRKYRRKLLKARADLAKLGTFRHAPEAWGPPATLDDDPSFTAQWFWSEHSAEHRSSHTGATDGSEWVPYTEVGTAMLEDAFQEYQKGGRHVHSMTINSSVYTADVRAMTQRSAATAFERPVKRIAPREGAAVRSSGAITTLHQYQIPQALIESGDPILELRKNDLIDVTREDGAWAYGTAYTQSAGGSGSRTGWFPLAATVMATNEQTLSLRDSLGVHEASDLDPPDTWASLGASSGGAVQTVEVALTSPEGRDVVASFDKTANRLGTVTQIHRIQNLSLWQSYIVRELQTKNRVDNTNPSHHALVRDVMWHGTTKDIADKIMQQGFNRSFCGRNMCRYGKGVYFAVMAAYSANPAYAQPDARGECRIFRCRVAHGVYCEGQNNALTPGVLDAATHRLFDSTTDNVAAPTMMVTYHDAQAYPEYMLLFVHR
jgi:poly [ADP-ribose] polymerase 10/14/15